MEQRLLRMAITDPLTGLSNRRAFNERLQLEWARLKRSPEIQAALVLCDIDHFKRINDTYGHGCGDEVLKHFASRLREHVRATDMAARIGGGGIRCVVGSGIDRRRPSMGGAISSGRCGDSAGVWRGVDQL
ncbi:TPA: GGDEF domain-containing protein [Escherichia coli]